MASTAVAVAVVDCFMLVPVTRQRNQPRHFDSLTTFHIHHPRILRSQGSRTSSFTSFMAKQNTGSSSSSSTSSSSILNSPSSSSLRTQKDAFNVFHQLNKFISQRSNGATTTTTKLYDLINGDTRSAKIGDYGSSTESFGTDYIPLDITCDPNHYHPDCIDDDVPGYTGFDRDSFLNLFIPTIAPVIAFFTFDYVASIYGWVIDVLEGSKTWAAVDGGAFQAKILTPAINGLVVPAIALLFATLTSTTISTLRQRQVDVRSAINMEAGELRALECSIESFEMDSFEQEISRDYLIQYTSRILAECHPKLGTGEDVINPRRGMDSELNGFTALLNKAYGTSTIPAHIADECYASVARLREHRTNRISALQSVYPFLHWISLALLALGECLAFLMETDQNVLVFLNAIQIRILWSMLVGTFVACFTVFFDLLSPFSGSYQISASVGQLHTIKLTLQASKQLSMNRLLREKEQQQNEQEQQEAEKKEYETNMMKRRKQIDLAQQKEFFNLMNAIEEEEDETIMKRTSANNLLRVSKTTNEKKNNKNRSTRNSTAKKNGQAYSESAANGTSFRSITFTNNSNDEVDGEFL
jgi:Protein of unknown function (DUF4239)